MARIELATSILKTDILPIKLHLQQYLIIPRTGFEPVTHRLKAGYFTIKLTRDYSLGRWDLNP